MTGHLMHALLVFMCDMFFFSFDLIFTFSRTSYSKRVFEKRVIWIIKEEDRYTISLCTCNYVIHYNHDWMDVHKRTGHVALHKASINSNINYRS
jgi:hypothetical protein